MIAGIIQTMILISGVAAIALLTRGGRMEFWGCVVGVIGQPFWIITTAQAEQWGMLILSLAYLWAFAAGVKRHWPEEWSTHD